MKTISLTSTILFFTLQLLAQDFAPIGAEWYYSEAWVFSGDEGYFKITSIKDTTYQGKVCHKLIKENKLYCMHRPDIEYIYSEDSAVYFWDNDFNEFQKLYDFKSQKNSSWFIKLKDSQDEIDSIIISVDSTGILIINEKQLKVLFVTYTTLYHNSYNLLYTSKIVEKIGDFRYLFNLSPESALVCDANFSDGLRCYEDPSFGFYSTGIVDSCTYTYKWQWIDIKNNIKDNLILYPNPANETICISGLNNLEQYQIFDMNGRIIKSDIIKDSQIVIKDLSKGFYLISIFDSKGILQLKEKILKN
jgi:hypothetical protein